MKNETLAWENCCFTGSFVRGGECKVTTNLSTIQWAFFTQLTNLKLVGQRQMTHDTKRPIHYNKPGYDPAEIEKFRVSKCD